MMMKPPPNYIPGIGRGATGFTTRSDIGPANNNNYNKSSSIVESEENNNDNLSHKFDGDDDEFGVFASLDYDKDDDEADAIWANIDKQMASRRKQSKQDNIAALNTISVNEEVFPDSVKRKLYEISESEWNNLPESKDYSLKCRYKKHKRFESFEPMPDTLLEKARIEKELVTALDPKSRAAGGTATPWGQNLTAVGEGRGIMLSMKLDRLSDSVSGLTVVNPKGYLNDLKSMSGVSNVSDTKKVRSLLKSVTQSNPKNPLGWLAAALFEEETGDIKAARCLIQKGCDECPKSEDLWLKACSLASPDKAKAVIARGVKANSDSVNLWMRAAELEHDIANRSRVLRKAIDHISDSVRLWKAVVELANEEDAKILLHRAVESCPLHVDFWVALARLETYENAKKVLNKAKEKLSKEPVIWISAAKLEDAKGNTEMVGKIIERGLWYLQREGLSIDREFWMKEAEVAEQAGSIATCQAIIRNTIGFGVEDMDRKRTWVADAEECEKKGSVETARAIYAHAMSLFLTKKSIWLKAAQLEKSQGNMESHSALLKKAVTYMPQKEILWLMAAKEKWLSGDVPSARTIIQEAYAAIPNSEEIWLAAFKLEFQSNEIQRARMLLAKARERGGTGRVSMKSAIVERKVGDTEEERRLLEEGLRRFPSFFKMWLMLGQLKNRLGNLEEAKEAYLSGLKHCPRCIPLWISLASLEERVNGLSKARATFTTARIKNPKDVEIWLAAVRAELRHDNKKEADVLMAKALQECPASGILWAASIEMAPHPQRKTKSNDARKNCKDDPHVIAAIGKLHWQNRKLEKARDRLKLAVSVGPDIGDLWALYYKFELQHGTEEMQKAVLKKCKEAKPKHGESWQAIAKAVENSDQPTEAILKKAVVALGKDGELP